MRFVPHLSRKITLVLSAVLILLFVPPFFLYVKFSRLVDEKVKNGPFANTSNIYSAPVVVSPGDPSTQEDVAARLHRAGYTEDGTGTTGYYAVRGRTIEIHPGPDSYFRDVPAAITFNDKGVANITSLKEDKRLQSYSLEPVLITNFVEGDRERRRLVRFQQIPQALVQALTSAEDKHFFRHLGFDPLRILKAAYVDFRSGRKEQGASTLSMQLARNFWLDADKRWKRKLNELGLTIVMESKLSKEQIFEAYCNQVYLGQQETFSIHGFGEAANAYFGKDISKLTIPEAATLAGLVQRPSYFNPFRYPERAVARRNAVLTLMQQNGYISGQEYASAISAPLGVQKRKLDTRDAPYFMALMNDELQDLIPDNAPTGFAHKVYTTLDPDLQSTAQEAVQIGMAEVDKRIRARRGKHSKETALPQVALIAIEPHTGEIKALVGGRNYAESQLNHAISKRQPGSVFKPFVYAAALSTAVEGKKTVFTESSTVVDEPATFRYENQVYQPSNFENQFYGRVTLRRALAKSMNLATVSLAEKIGYDNVVRLAKKAGLNEDIKPTPAMALGAYECTPLEIAGAYTAFANNGVWSKPTFISMIRNSQGKTVSSGDTEQHPALDPRVAYLMIDMMKEVMRSGTAAGVRSRGFSAEAAGKTGTSRDGWFAGFTPELLCVVWVGFDDNRELDLEGAHSALPIWTEFMKRAVKRKEFAQPFPPPPPGIVKVSVDPDSGLLAGPECGGSGITQLFIKGTEPKAYCTAPDPQFFDPFTLRTGLQQ